MIYLCKHPLSLLIPESERAATIEEMFVYFPYMILCTFFEIEYEGIKSYLLAHKYTFPFVLI